MDLLAEDRFARARRPRDADEDRSALGVRLQELDRADGEEETLIEREVILDSCDLLIERREGEDRGQGARVRAKRVLFEGRGAGAATRLSGGRHARVSRARRIRRVTGRIERAGWNPRIEKGEEGSERDGKGRTSLRVPPSAVLTSTSAS